jgi:hypothetical protein
VIAAAIPDEVLLPTDECFAQEVPEPETGVLNFCLCVSMINHPYLKYTGYFFIHNPSLIQIIVLSNL